MNAPKNEPPAPEKEEERIVKAAVRDGLMGSFADLSLGSDGESVAMYLAARFALRAQRAIDAKEIEQYQRRIGEMQTDFRDLKAEVERLRLKARLVDRLPFCPDHRDKVTGMPCRECEIERLKKLLRAALLMGHLPPAIEAKIDAAIRPKANPDPAHLDDLAGEEE